MQELRVYIETSVWSHVFHDETPDFQRATVEFLKQAKERVVGRVAHLLWRWGSRFDGGQSTGQEDTRMRLIVDSVA